MARRRTPGHAGRNRFPPVQSMGVGKLGMDRISRMIMILAPLRNPASQGNA